VGSWLAAAPLVRLYSQQGHFALPGTPWDWGRALFVSCALCAYVETFPGGLDNVWVALTGAFSTRILLRV
jgi:hypothetical protein